MNTQAARALARPWTLCFSLFCLGATGAAQTERIQLRLVPQPDQWVQFHMVQEISSGAAAAGDRVVPDMLMKMVATFTQTTGHPDPDGRVKAEVTYDEFSGTMTSDGKTTSAPVPSALLGEQMTVTYDANGKVVDVQAPSGMPANIVAKVRQIMTSTFAGFGANAIAIGETVSTPIDITMPSPTNPAPALTGTNAMTLRSISETGGERIAHFDQKMQLSMESAHKLPSRDGVDAPTMTMIMKMVGTGTMDYNVNRGFMITSRMNSTMDTKTSFDHPLPKGMPNIDMHMTMKTSVDATY